MTSAPNAEKLLQTPELSMDKLPVLHNIFDRLAPACAEMMRHICAVPVSFFLNQANTGSSWDVLEAYDDSIAVVFFIPEWETRILIGVDRRFIFSLIEAMFGGDMSEAQFVASRPFTPLEARIGRMVCEMAASALQASFTQIAPITPVPERTETALDFTVLGQSNFPAVTAQLLFQVLEGGGRLFLLMPQAPFYTMRQKLEHDRPINMGIADQSWSVTMQSQMASTEVQLDAVLKGDDVTLFDLAQIKPGKVLSIRPEQINPVILECNGERLYVCKLGQSGGVYTLELTDHFKPEREFLGDVLSEAAASSGAPSRS